MAGAGGRLMGLLPWTKCKKVEGCKRERERLKFVNPFCFLFLSSFNRV